MSRILAIDYGMKRCGIAISDPLKIIANPYSTIHTNQIFNELKKIIIEKEVELIVVGYPIGMRGQTTGTTLMVDKFVQQLASHFPQISIQKLDERLTSKMAEQTMIMIQAKKSDRQNKSNTDVIAATILLQNYLDYSNQK